VTCEAAWTERPPAGRRPLEAVSGRRSSSDCRVLFPPGQPAASPPFASRFWDAGKRSGSLRLPAAPCGAGDVTGNKVLHVGGGDVFIHVMCVCLPGWSNPPHREDLEQPAARAAVGTPVTMLHTQFTGDVFLPMFSFSTRSPRVLHAFSTCSPRVLHVFSTRSPRVLHPFSTCSPRVLHAFSTRSPRVLHVFSTRSPRVLHAFSMRSPRVLHPFSTCSPPVLHVFSTRSLQ